MAAIVLAFCGVAAAFLSIQEQYFLGEMDFDTSEFMPEILSTGTTDYSLHPAISPLLAPFAAARAAGSPLWPALQINMLLFIVAAFAAFVWLLRPLVSGWTGAIAGAGLFLLVPGIQQVNSTMSDKVLTRPLLLCALALLMGLIHARNFRPGKAFAAIAIFMAALAACLAYFTFIPLIAALLVWRYSAFNSRPGRILAFTLGCAAFAAASGLGVCLLNDFYSGRAPGHTLKQAYAALAFPAEFTAAAAASMQGSMSRLFFVGISETLFGSAQLAGQTGIFRVQYLLSHPFPSALGKITALILLVFLILRIVNYSRSGDLRSAAYFAILLAWLAGVSAFLYWFRDHSVFERWEFLPAVIPFLLFRVGDLPALSKRLLAGAAAAYCIAACVYTIRSPSGTSSMAQLSSTCTPSGKASVFSESDLTHKGAAIHAYLAGCRPLSVIEYDYGSSPFQPPEHLRPDWRVPRTGPEIERLRREFVAGRVFASPAAATILRQE